ncbi:hypothetical protein HPB52_001891 [Rhipicephalus sanguineus]|uniref:Uncharacterized protein n=1 Tax=Rhipicephalus sanguineus TaxID=34632 RepID=A0A9D4PYH2_RHISA|nr:hypothetical protein HPB52_001891 [Rhipicephalus sanguineus]
MGVLEDYDERAAARGKIRERDEVRSRVLAKERKKRTDVLGVRHSRVTGPECHALGRGPRVEATGFTWPLTSSASNVSLRQDATFVVSLPKPPLTSSKIPATLVTSHRPARSTPRLQPILRLYLLLPFYLLLRTLQLCFLRLLVLSGRLALFYMRRRCIR